MNYYLVLISITSLVAVIANGDPFDVDKSLELLCENKTVESLTKISQIRAIVKLLRSDPKGGDCPQDVRDALFDISLVVDEDTDDVCSMEKVEQIRNYHVRYISTIGNSVNSLSKSLKNFFIGFALEVSKICKKNMINSLEYDSHKMLTPEDFSTMDFWINTEDSLMKKIIVDNTKDYDDLLLMSDVNRLTAFDDELSLDTKHDKIFIQTATGSMIKKIQLACRRRFKPIYDKLILPLIKLANIGYNYQGEELERELSELKTNKEVQQWYKIVYLCESMVDIVIVETSEDKAKTEGIDRKLVRILTKEEAEELEDNNNSEQVVGHSDGDNLNNQIVYKPEDGNPIGDKIIDSSDRDLVKMISKFNTRRGEIDRIRVRWMRKFGNLLKDSLLKGQIHVVSSLLGWNRNKQQEQKIDVNEDLVKALDEYIHDVAKSSGIDSPVAGIKDRITGYTKRVYHTAAYQGPSGIARNVHNATVGKLQVGKIFYRTLAVILLVVGLIMCFHSG